MPYNDIVRRGPWFCWWLVLWWCTHKFIIRYDDDLTDPTIVHVYCVVANQHRIHMSALQRKYVESNSQ